MTAKNLTPDDDAYWIPEEREWEPMMSEKDIAEAWRLINAPHERQGLAARILVAYEDALKEIARLRGRKEQP